MAKTLTQEEKAAQDAATIEQQNAQIQVLNQRVTDLAGNAAEVTALRESNAKLQAQLDQASTALQAAVREASQARAAEISANQNASASGGKVAAAENLARSLKELLK